MVIANHAGFVKIVINKRRDREDFSLNYIKEQFAKGYIIVVSPKGFISSYYPVERHSRQPMAVAARQQFCGDTLNIFGHEDQKFQWYKEYLY
jgi:hypothetical protein